MAALKFDRTASIGPAGKALEKTSYQPTTFYCKKSLFCSGCNACPHVRYVINGHLET